MYIPGSSIIYFISYPKDRITGQGFVNISNESKKQVHLGGIRHVTICYRKYGYIVDLSSITCSGMRLKMLLLSLVKVSSSLGRQ